MASSTILLDSIQIEIGGDNEWPDDAKLFQPYETEQILMPDSANCLAVQAFLQMVNLKYEVVYKANAAEMSPTGRVPFIKVGQYLIVELEPIVTFVQNKNISLTSNLTDAEKADMRVYMSLITTVLGNAENYVTWCDSETYDQVTKKRFGSVYPFPLNLYLLWKKRSATIERMKALGGRTEKEAVLDEVELCCQTLADRLGDEEFFFKTGPTELDCLLFAHVYTILNWPSLHIGNRLAQILCKYPSLVYHGSQLKKCVRIYRNDVLNIYEPLMTAYHNICSVVKEKSVAEKERSVCQKCQDVVTQHEGSESTKLMLYDGKQNDSAESLSSDWSSSIRSDIFSTLCEIKAFSQNGGNQIYKGTKPDVKIDSIALSCQADLKSAAKEVVLVCKSKQTLHVRIQENNNGSDLVFKEGRVHDDEQVKRNINNKNTSLPSLFTGASCQESRLLYPTQTKNSYLPLDSPFLMKCHQLFNPCRSLVTMMRVGSISNSNGSVQNGTFIKDFNQRLSSSEALCASKEIAVAGAVPKKVSNIVLKNSCPENSVPLSDRKTREEDSYSDEFNLKHCIKVGGGVSQTDVISSNDAISCGNREEKIGSFEPLMAGITESNSVSLDVNCSNGFSGKCSLMESSLPNLDLQNKCIEPQESKGSSRSSCKTRHSSWRGASGLLSADSSEHGSAKIFSGEVDDACRKNGFKKTRIPILWNNSKENGQEVLSVAMKPATPSKPLLFIKKTAVKNVKSICSPRPKPDIKLRKGQDPVIGSNGNHVKRSVTPSASGKNVSGRLTSKISTKKKYPTDVCKVVSKTEAFAKVGQDMKQFFADNQVSDCRDCTFSEQRDKPNLLVLNSAPENKIMCENTVKLSEAEGIEDHGTHVQSTFLVLKSPSSDDSTPKNTIAIEEHGNDLNIRESCSTPIDMPLQTRSILESNSESSHLSPQKNLPQEELDTLLNQSILKKNSEKLSLLSDEPSSPTSEINLQTDSSSSNITGSESTKIQTLSSDSTEIIDLQYKTEEKLSK